MPCGSLPLFSPHHFSYTAAAAAVAAAVPKAAKTSRALTIKNKAIRKTGRAGKKAILLKEINTPVIMVPGVAPEHKVSI